MVNYMKQKKIGIVQFPIQLNVYSVTDIKTQVFGDFIVEPNYKEMYLNLISDFEYIYKYKSTNLDELSSKLENKNKDEIKKILKELL